MLEIHPHSRPGRPAGSRLVCDHPSRQAGLLADELAQEFLRRVSIPAALNQSVKNKAVGIDSAPQPMLLAIDCDHDFVEMPFVTEPRHPPTDLVGRNPTACLRPGPHGLKAHDNSTRRQQVFDHAQAEGKAENSAKPRAR